MKAAGGRRHLSGSRSGGRKGIRATLTSQCIAMWCHELPRPPRKMRAKRWR